MEPIDWQDLHGRVSGWIKEAGQRLRESLTETIDVNFKSSHDDLVTNMDKQTEQFFIENVHQHYPEHQIVSEEGFGDDVSHTNGIIWLIDPIDGTMNFVHQKRHFAISIGIYQDGIGQAGFIYDVMTDELYHAIKGEGAFLNDRKLNPLKPVKFEESILGINLTWINKNRRIDPEIMKPIALKSRGTRSYGSAAIELAYVASGLLDLYFTMRLSPWDYGAGLILLEEVGGVATRVNGEKIDLLKQNSIMAGNPSIHKAVNDHIQQALEKDGFLNDEPLK